MYSFHATHCDKYVTFIITFDFVFYFSTFLMDEENSKKRQLNILTKPIHSVSMETRFTWWFYLNLNPYLFNTLINLIIWIIC